MKNAKQRNRRESGIAFIMTALLLVFSIPFIGLAVDAGTLYVIKGKLSAAVDASALAAGRSVNLASTVAQANNQATTVAQQFFGANFPTGFMNTIGAPSMNVTFNQQHYQSSGNVNGILDITVTASTVAPTYFMRIIGFNNVTVAATGTATRRGSILIMVLDTSSSMNTSPAPSACQTMVSAARSFIQYFSPYDTLGMVWFDYTAHVGYAPSTNWGVGNALDSAIAGLSCNNNTNTSAGLELAYQQVKAVNLPLALNAILLFTDGVPNGVTANYPIRTLKQGDSGNKSDNRWGQSNDGNPNGLTGSSYGQRNGCSTNQYCLGMKMTCSAPPGSTIYGTVTQVSGINSWGGSIGSLYHGIQGDSLGTAAGCNYSGDSAKQMIAYIPDRDAWGNSTHGVPATVSASTPFGTVQNTPDGNYVTRDFWLFQVNNVCAQSSWNISPQCKNIGDQWSNYPTIGTGSNYIPDGLHGNTPMEVNSYWSDYPDPSTGSKTNKLRIDQPNSIVAASMNTGMAEALKIRSDTTFNTTVHVIYLTGNGGDSVDREFLPIIANVQTIPPLPYQDNATIPPYTFATYPNPAYVQGQQIGKYLVTADKTQLPYLFAQIASSVLRLSR